MDWVDELSLAWRREYPRLDVSTLPPLVRLARIVILLEGFQREVLAPFDLSPGDYAVLATLRRTGSPHELSPSQLYGGLRRSSGGMTKILKRLERRGLVRRSPDPADGRGFLVALTGPGLALQEQVFAAFLAASNDLLAPLGRTRLREVDRSLRALLDSVEAYFAGNEARPRLEAQRA